MKNPYDLLDLPADLDAAALDARLRAALPGAPPLLRATLEAALADLEQAPDTRLAWLLTSRSGGEVHPWDAALRAAPPPLPEAPVFQGEPRAAGVDRARQVAELVDLPALEHPRAFAEGLAPRGAPTPEEDP